jgi:hypothetical protein
MRRALAPGGRVGLVVWGALERNPYFHALAQAVGRHVEAEAGARLRSPFALSDVETVRALLAGAGFDRVRVRPQVKSVLLPPLAEFVPRHLAGTSIAPQVAALDAAARRALLADLAESVRSFASGGGVRAPFEALVASGAVPAARPE